MIAIASIFNLDPYILVNDPQGQSGNQAMPAQLGSSTTNLNHLKIAQSSDLLSDTDYENGQR
jgi:hypothetical protein